MATTTKVTEDLIKWYYGTEAAYNGAKDTFKTGIYICTDNGKLYVRGTEVRDRNAITSASDYKLKSVSYNKTSRVLTITQQGGTSVTATLDAVDYSDGSAGYGVVSADTLKSLYEAASMAQTAAAAAQQTADTANSTANSAKSTLDGFNAAAKTALTKATNAAGGVVVVGSDSKIPASVMPSYVDDVVNFSGTVTGITATAGPVVVSGVTAFYYDTTGKRFVATNDGGKTYVTSWTDDSLTNVPTASAPEAGKIYVDTTKNTTYRWGGTDLVQIKGDLAIGTTAGTAFDGAKGAALETKVNNLDTRESNDKVTAISYNAGTQRLTLTKGSGTIVQGNTFPAVDNTNPGLMTVAQKKELEQLRTDLGKKTDAASADGSAFARIAKNKADIATATSKANSAIKTIADGVGGWGKAGMTIQTTTVDGTAGTITLPAASGATDDNRGGQSGVMSGTDKVVLDSVAAVVASTAYWYQATVQ